MRELIRMDPGSRSRLEECVYVDDNFSYINIEDILTGAVRIAVDNKSNICTHGTDCHTDVTELYRYKDWIIKYKYYTEARSDLDVQSILYYFKEYSGHNNYMDSDYPDVINIDCVLDEFFTVTLLGSDDIGVLEKSDNLKYITNYFRNVYPNDGQARLAEYIIYRSYACKKERN